MAIDPNNKQPLESSVALAYDGYPLEECEMQVMLPRGQYFPGPITVKFKKYEYDPYKVDDEIELKKMPLRESIENAFDKQFTDEKRRQLESNIKHLMKELRSLDSSFTTRRIIAAFAKLFSSY